MFLSRFGLLCNRKTEFLSRILSKSDFSSASIPATEPVDSDKSDDKKRDRVKEKARKKIEALKKEKAKKNLKNPLKETESLQFVKKSLAYLNIKEKISEQLAPRYFKVNSVNPTTSYLIDGPTASKIIDYLSPEDWAALSFSPVLELNPGFGVLTEELKRSGVTSLTGLEPEGKLLKLLSQRPALEGVKLINKGFADFPRLHHQDKADGEHRVNKILSEVTVEDSIQSIYIEKRPLLVFGSVLHISLINFLIKSLVTGQILWEEELPWSAPHFYVAVGPKVHWILSASPQSGYFLYRPTAVLFQLFFESELLGTLPRRSYIPWTKESLKGISGKFHSENKLDKDLVYFLKFKANQQLLQELGKDQLLPLWYFVRQHLFSRANFIIPELERWIPGCGARLVRKGFTIYSRFGELTPKQILEVYKEFISWPEFPQSSFQIAIEKFQHRFDPVDDKYS